MLTDRHLPKTEAMSAMESEARDATEGTMSMDVNGDIALMKMKGERQTMIATKMMVLGTEQRAGW